jgi:sulfide dehydrogenase [flavocytochrome c] flavoprotein subunit
MLLSRRNAIKTAVAGAAGLAAMGMMPLASAAAGKKVVIVGGGIGGATAAKYLRIYDKTIEVTLIEANPDYHTCFMSNEVITGFRKMSSIKFGYAGLKAHGVNVVHDLVTDIDAAGKTVKTKGGQSFAFDRCIVSPGVDFKYDAIEGHSEEAANTTCLHAWKAGPQTEALKKQLEDMSDGGTVVIVAPPDPFRCPPGPYERASLISAYLKDNKPNSKVVILDPKEAFSKQGLFMDGWKRYYGLGTEGGMLKWIGGKEGGKVTKVDTATKTVTYGGGTIKADVLNIIPAQKAGKIAVTAGLADEKGWCPVNHKTFESTLKAGIHVIGDASVAAPMPKSGYAANSEAKVCAAAVFAALTGRDMAEPSWVNTCYSVIKPGSDAISVANVYALKDGKIVSVEGSGGVSGKFDPEMRKREELYAHSWFNNITTDVFN